MQYFYALNIVKNCISGSAARMIAAVSQASMAIRFILMPRILISLYSQILVPHCTHR